MPAVRRTFVLGLLLAIGLLGAGVAAHVDPSGSADRQVRTIGIAGASGDVPVPIEMVNTPPTTTLAATATTTQADHRPTTSLVTTTAPTVASTVPHVPSSTTTTTAGTSPRTTSPPTTRPPLAPNGDGVWTGVMNGVSTTLRMVPVEPHAGDTVHFSITAGHATQWCCTTSFYTGDGAVFPPSHPTQSCPETHPSTFTKTIDHVYDHAGTFDVEVQPSAGDYCSGLVTFINSQLYVTITVAPAR